MHQLQFEHGMKLARLLIPDPDLLCQLLIPDPRSLPVSDPGSRIPDRLLIPDQLLIPDP